MTDTDYIKFVFAILIALIYLFFTIRYSFDIGKNMTLSNKLKIVHIILIWTIPFVWMVILKNLTQQTPGSHQVDKTKENKPFFDAYKNFE
ncbi:hypothetical protein L0U88_20450 [Flavihumibacter sp. RY-1]|uniref:Uncharacterized protein n=1 Tax=Flavihumibacter fluminis TaxID=2909236 RepID=A0ABS9BNW8_9BACT|nr:hypothetical protein [Flavihumibacter fluminis]MCF1717025.1 hypothetical protein [Flavihumibacter fluminis]